MNTITKKDELRQIYQKEESAPIKYIPAKPVFSVDDSDRILNVCAYCRVSTDNDEQLSSFELQQKHYREVAENHPSWNLKHIYADEGISGTSLKNRDQFNEMIAACKKGEYDLIVTKSVSRFARNLVDCISLVRKLKGQNPPVGVFFETDNLNTLSQESELMLAFLATFAQEESVKKSEAMRWSLQQRFKDGKLLTPAPLGYERPVDAGGHYIKYGKLEIVESEAEIVRFIFNAFIAGRSTKEIAALLTDIECPTKTGGTTWNEGTVTYILQNERYCGNVLTWKTFTDDMFEHTHKKNRQNRDQYLYEEHHDAIISREIFEAAQVLFENHRRHMRGGYPVLHVINDGAFRGFVPVNHHWINDDPNTYYTASDSAPKPVKTIRIKKSSFSAFDLKGYQVVRGQFMSTRYECPAMSVVNGKITFNMVCMKKFFGVTHIQLLLHPAEHQIAIRPCSERDTYSIPWCRNGNRIHSKVLNCEYFCSALFRIMKWNPDFLYRIRGTWITNGSRQIIIFNLDNAVPAIMESGRKTRRTELCPDKWSTSFGDDFYDYALQNRLYFESTQTDLQSDSKSVPVPDQSAPDILSEEDLQFSFEKIKTQAGGSNGN